MTTRWIGGMFLIALLSGCGTTTAGGPGTAQAAALRGFGVEVDATVAATVPGVHLKTCGRWGCHEQDVPLVVTPASPATSVAPCPTATPAADASCSSAVGGQGGGYGYAPVPELTMEPVTVTVTTPSGASPTINSSIQVRPHPVCDLPDGREGSSSGCADGTPQAQLRIGADGRVSQVG